MITYKLKVIALKQETEDTVTVSFKQPGLKRIAYKAGQYLTLIFKINGRRYIRPYSFSSTYGIDLDLQITIKRVPGGVVSNHILDTVKVEDSIEVMPPLGDFTIDEDAITENAHVILWGVGSGITPLFSIAKYLLHKKTGNRVTLVYGNRSIESVIFLSALEQLQQSFKEHFNVLHYHTRPVMDISQTHILQGRIHPENALQVISKHSSLHNTLHYICGPSGLKESVKTALASVQIPEDHIFSEDFEVIKNPTDFNDIHTRTVEIIKDQQSVLVEVTKGKSILEAGLDAMLELDYSCQTGSCAVCRATITEGAIKIIGTVSQPEKLRTNEYLLCCAYPLTDGIKIHI